MAHYCRCCVFPTDLRSLPQQCAAPYRWQFDPAPVAAVPMGVSVRDRFIGTAVRHIGCQVEVVKTVI